MEDFEKWIKQISSNIKYFRKNNNMTQNKLSQKSGILQSTISDYENEKKMNLHNLFRIAEALDIPISELLLLKQYPDKGKMLFPISKMLNRVYYCYYVENSFIKCFQLKIFNNRTRYNADAKIKFNSKTEWINGEITLDNKFAVAIINIPNRNKHHILTFNYFHDSDNEKYIGGVGLYQTINSLITCPQVQFCVISDKEIKEEKQLELRYKFLNLENGYDNSKQLCGPTIKEDLDKKLYHWLKGEEG